MRTQGQSLALYNRKRDFRHTPEPRGVHAGKGKALQFVVQKHAASRLHYDFRLEVDGVLKSWAVPKGPSLDPAVKRMAVQVEDHPLAYGGFEGVIPKGHYGAGSVIVWDRGSWEPLEDPRKALRAGKLKFRLQGEKLHGGFTLVRMRGRGDEKQPSWLLIKERDDEARPSAEFDVVEQQPESVLGAGSAPGKSARSANGTAARPVGGSMAAEPASGAKGRRPRKSGKATLPLSLAPQLATLMDAPPVGDWHYELKFDGYRLLTRFDGGDVRCITRNGHDWSSRVPGIVTAVKAMKPGSGWLDGELVALDERGAPDFQKLQNAFESHRTTQLRYFVFDLLFHEGEDLRELGNAQRRERLHALMGDETHGPVQFSPTLQGDPRELLAASGRAGFEGLIGKRADAPYRAGRSRDWIKLKVGQRQEFVIGGFTDPQGSRSGLGSLLLGVHDEAGRLRYAGNVGTGFDTRTLDALRSRLDGIEASASPFFEGPQKVGTTRRAVPHWVKPKLVAEISFAGWTQGGHVRQGVFHGLREDKEPRRITREQAVHPVAEEPPQQSSPSMSTKTRGQPKAKAKAATRPRSKARTQPAAALPEGLRVTHPERVIDASAGITKGDLVAYYAQVAPLMLPHLEDRPVALLRAPAGIEGEKFFQKHAEARALPHVTSLDPSLDPGNGAILAINSTEALLSVAQMNTVELHTWNATAKEIEKPDRMIFDLDPGEGVGWKEVRDAATLVRSMLEELKLAPFLKSSGGKGLHVVVPLKPEHDWVTVKAFSKAVVEHLSRVLPQRFVAKSGGSNRVGRIFVDYLRNGRGSTTVAAWSARARPGMGISVPMEWDELKQMKALPDWTVQNFQSRLEVGNAPWKAYARSRRSLTAAMRKLDFKPDT